MKTTIPQINTSVGRRVVPAAFNLLSVAHVLFWLAPLAQAVSPAPDGGYPGGNTAEGQQALLSLTTGVYNTAVALKRKETNGIGNANTAIGAGALFANTADQNTATGAGALFSNSTGEANAAHGAFALFNNTDGSNNTATGFLALGGAFALGDGTIATGNHNTALGAVSLSSNTEGFQNTAVGAGALANNTIGSYNIALGSPTGGNVTTASNVICIGHPGLNVDNSCFIGHIRDALVAPDAIPVLIDSAGKLGTTSGSSRRFKKEIKPMDRASESILRLKPVSFHYKNDSKRTTQFGLIAEEVAEVNADLVVRDDNGDICTVRYDAVNAMLLNEFLKEHKKVGELEATVAEQQKSFQSKLAEQERQIKALAAGLQKVSAEVEISRPTLQMVVNKPQR